MIINAGTAIQMAVTKTVRFFERQNKLDIFNSNLQSRLHKEFLEQLLNMRYRPLFSFIPTSLGISAFCN